MKRSLLFALGGVLLGGIIHIAIILALPYFAVNDAWARLAKTGPVGEFQRIGNMSTSETDISIPALDPFMAQAACRFTLAEGPVRVTASMPDEFWSVAVFDRHGRNVYSLNDRAAERQRLDLVILTPVQVAQLRQNPPASLETAIVLDLPISEGIVVLRAFMPDASYVPTVDAALREASCADAL